MAMNEKNYVMIMAVAGILLIVYLIYLAGSTGVFSPKNTTIEEFVIPEFESIPEQTVDCKLCHIQPESLPKHVKGGNYCKECHESDVHGLHLDVLTDTFTCDTCHGSNQTIPQKLPEHTVICDTCHNYPDPSQPSYGNLIIIHITKGHTCNLCHIQDLQNLHKAASSNKTQTQ